MVEAWGRWRRGVTLAGWMCVAVIALEDWLLYRKPIGFTVGLFGLALLAVITIRNAAYLRRWPGRLVGLALLGLFAACVEQPGLLSISLGAAGLMTAALINRSGWTAQPGRWPARWGQFLVLMWIQIPRDYVLARQWRHRRSGKGRGQVSGRQIAGWLLPILLSLIFLGLFCAANPLISKWMGNLGERFQHFYTDFFDFVNFPRILLWAVVGVSAWALMRTRTRDAEPAIATEPGRTGEFDRILTPTVIIRCLVLFNLLFLVQSMLDVFYLWGGAQLPDGMSYSEYARRGAYPLVATALLAAAFVLATFRAGAPSERMDWARGLVSLWIAQNIFLTVSAGWRLALYVEAFSLTRLRFAAGIWMLLVAFGLATIIWRLVAQRSNAWLVRINFLAALGVLYACGFVNFDGLIASYNVRHCREIAGQGSSIDLRYISDLGPESIPSLEWIAKHLPAEHASIASDASRRAVDLRASLVEELADWRGWTWRRRRLALGQ